MPKAVSVAEAERRFAALLGHVDQGAEVVVESDGKPTAVLMSFAAYEEVRELRDQKRRTDALADLLRLRDQVSARHRDPTEDEIEPLAEEISQEAIARLVERGELSFERDRR